MNPTHEQVIEALPHVRFEIESFLQTPHYDRSNRALEESVYFRKMAHCRVLYDFFKKKRLGLANQNKDDVVAEDFGFPSSDVYGSNAAEFLKRFNKDLLHLTYDRLKRSASTKPWPMEDLFPPVVQRAKEFIDHVLVHFLEDVSEVELKLWRDLKSDVEGGVPLQQNTSNIAASTVSSIEVTVRR